MKAMTSTAAVRTRKDEATRTRRPAVRLTTAPVRAARTGTAAPPTIQAPARTTGRHATAAPRAPFALLVVGLLGGALVGLLLLNTALAQQSFKRSELQQENQRLEERRQALQEDIARESSPEVLRAKARRLGMRDSDDPVVAGPGR
ncbi:FtsB family cell division protein [Actinoallomurus acaciae]|uniref:Septum formation initiator family protein n=1 Tax=Actinoallomurus acaciae TaxID=502577 RepID=A0ABV5YCI9_9ACTN